MIYDDLIKQILSGRGDNDVTTVDEILKNIRIERPVAVEALKRIGDRGLGKFVIGRRGAETRIEWLMSDASYENSGDKAVTIQEPISNSNLAPLSKASLDGKNRVMKEYSFTLDATYDIRFQLPRDLTANEAERIAQFVRSQVSST